MIQYSKAVLRNLVLAGVVAVFSLLFVSCSAGKKASPANTPREKIVPALSSAERLIMFARSGNPIHLQGVFTDSVLDLMSIEGMVDTRQDFVRSFGRLLKAEGPFYSSDSTASIVFHHEELTVVAFLGFDKRGQIRSINIQQEPLEENLGAN
jgi:hypothetical protein